MLELSYAKLNPVAEGTLVQAYYNSRLGMFSIKVDGKVVRHTTHFVLLNARSSKGVCQGRWREVDYWKLRFFISGNNIHKQFTPPHPIELQVMMGVVNEKKPVVLADPKNWLAFLEVWK